MKNVRYRMIQKADTANDLIGVFAFKHRGEQFNAAEGVPNLVSELHRHFTHGGEPLQPYPLVSLSFEIFRKDANAVLQIAVRLLQCLRRTLKGKDEIF
jgi:hypothetical protein